MVDGVSMQSRLDLSGNNPSGLSVSWTINY